MPLFPVGVVMLSLVGVGRIQGEAAFLFFFLSFKVKFKLNEKIRNFLHEHSGATQLQRVPRLGDHVDWEGWGKIKPPFSLRGSKLLANQLILGLGEPLSHF